jgi:hypothetical protein
MNVLLCVGCDSYDSLPSLSGAEKDAKGVFALLSPKCEGDEQTLSKLLLSPGLVSVQQALDALFAGAKDIDSFTFFFAGHGAVKAASFYLCVKDSAADRLSTARFR